MILTEGAKKHTENLEFRVTWPHRFLTLISMSLRIDSVLARVATISAVVTAVLVAPVVASAEPVATGEVDGQTVAVAAPPVPPTTAEVAVGLPPVPPTTAEVAVGLPPVPPTTSPARVSRTTTTTAPAVPDVELDPEVVAELTSLVVGVAARAALDVRR